MISCENIIQYLEELAPKETAESWDNVGLLCGNEEKAVERILLCLDVTSRVAEEAVKNKTDLIISHHPVIFKSLSRIVENDYKGRLLSKLIKNDISVYSAHTNLDAAALGVNQRLAERLGLIGIRPLKNAGCLSGDCSSEARDEKSFGKTGILPAEPGFGEFLEELKIKLDVKNIRLIGTPKEKLKNIAVFCGSFDGDLTSIKRSSVDLLVTGDVKYHTAVEAIEMGVCIIDAGHFNTEKIVLPPLADLIERKFTDIGVIISKVESDPFITY